MSIKQGRIDVHHHVIPPAFFETMRNKNISTVAGAQLPDWDVKKSIDVMNMNGIQTAIMSLSAPGVYFGNIRDACILARKCNEFSAEISVKHAGRFGSFAVLPMPYTEYACREAVYAFDILKADGVVLLGSTEGVFLGDSLLSELMTELNRRKAIVFVHPNLHISTNLLKLDIPGFLIEFLCDTTRAAVNLILTGTVEKYSNIKWILAHSGGFLPFIAQRVAIADEIPDYRIKIPKGVMHYIKSFYYDTALSPSRYSQVVLKELVDPDHILFGSDFPFAPDKLTTLQCRILEKSEIWADEINYGINRGHALKLFPRYALPDEVIIPKPVYSDEPVSMNIKRTFKIPVAEIIERIIRR